MAQVEVPDLQRSAAVRLNPKQTALVVVDMQNDFAHPEGKLFGAGTTAALPVIRDLLTRARRAGVRVVFTQDWHGEDDPEYEIWGEHAKAGTWGAELVAELAPQEGEAQIRKLRYDAFYGTSLDHLLRQWGTKSVIVCGTVANICVLHTAGSAALRYLQVVVPEDGIAALTPFDMAATLRQVTFLYRGEVAAGSDIEFALH